MLNISAKYNLLSLSSVSEMVCKILGRGAHSVAFHDVAFLPS